MSLRVIALALLLDACNWRTAEQEIERRKGPTPIACVRDIKGYERSVIFTCRDASQEVWVCARADDGTHCVPLKQVTLQWSAQQAEASHVQ